MTLKVFKVIYVTLVLLVGLTSWTCKWFEIDQSHHGGDFQCHRINLECWPCFLCLRRVNLKISQCNSWVWKFKMDDCKWLKTRVFLGENFQKGFFVWFLFVNWMILNFKFCLNFDCGTASFCSLFTFNRNRKLRIKMADNRLRDSHCYEHFENTWFWKCQISSTVSSILKIIQMLYSS